MNQQIINLLRKKLSSIRQKYIQRTQYFEQLKNELANGEQICYKNQILGQKESDFNTKLQKLKFYIQNDQYQRIVDKIQVLQNQINDFNTKNNDTLYQKVIDNDFQYLSSNAFKFIIDTKSLSKYRFQLSVLTYLYRDNNVKINQIQYNKEIIQTQLQRIQSYKDQIQASDINLNLIQQQIIDYKSIFYGLRDQQNDINQVLLTKQTYLHQLYESQSQDYQIQLDIQKLKTQQFHQLLLQEHHLSINNQTYKQFMTNLQAVRNQSIQNIDKQELYLCQVSNELQSQYQFLRDFYEKDHLQALLKNLILAQYLTRDNVNDNNLDNIQVEQ